MMQSDIFRPSWPFSSEFDPSSSEILSPFHYLPTDFSESLPFDEYPIEDLLMNTDGFDLESVLRFEFGSPDSVVTEVISSAQWSPGSSLRSESATEPSSVTQPQPLNLPVEDMEVDNHLSLHHLMKAYGEAMENGQAELMEVIAKCAADKADPYGESLERLAFYLFCRDREDDDYGFLRDEAPKNYESAFDAFYQMFPIGRFAHFSANKAVLESLPPHVEVLRVVDFDMGDGIQWAPLIEAIGRSQSRRIAFRVTSIKWEDEEESPDHDLRLRHHAMALGVELTVAEMKIEELQSEMNRTGRDKKEWMVFNCMVGLPHMGGGRRSRRSSCHVEKFLRVAQETIANNGDGIIAFGDGDGAEKLNCCSGFGEFIEGCVGHYQKLLELMDAELPSEFAEARLAMESLFVSPSVSSSDWLCKWEETRACLGGGVLKGARRIISRENLMEAMELVRSGKSSYGVRIGSVNEMVLEWRGTTMARISIWGKMNIS